MATKDLQAALRNFERGVMKNKGAPKVFLFRERTATPVRSIPFGVAEIDEATSTGGIPQGRMVEIFGPESGGKSWLTLKLIASAQRMGLRAALLDVEGAFDARWAASHGVDVDNLFYGNTFDYGEDVLQYVLGMAKSGVADLIVVDSVAALLPKEEVEKRLDEPVMGSTGRMMSRGIRQINDTLTKSGATVVFVNQVREKVGLLFGNPEVSPGGRALKFYSSMRIRVARMKTFFETVNGRKEPAYAQSRLKVEKNKVGIPFRSAEFVIHFYPDRQNNPYRKLAQCACDLRIFQRRSGNDGQKEYVWGKGKEAEQTGCAEPDALAAWIVGRGAEVIVRLVDEVRQRCQDGKQEVDPDILALADPGQVATHPMPAEASVADEEDVPPE